MPRQPRIDSPDLLHHVIVRGIERRKIFLDDDDRYNFVERFRLLLTETGTDCYAWALIPNHFHLLLKSHTTPLSHFMRRLLTGYAITFNHRHNRTGHLFQNRYKSIVCEEEAYLLELIRYIHLNPLRAGVVNALEELDDYSWCGHSAIIGNGQTIGMATAEVLSLFSQNKTSGRQLYRQFIATGVEQGRRPELVGGGLKRRLADRPGEGDSPLYDVRVLGGGYFVQQLQEQGILDSIDRPKISLDHLRAAITGRYSLTADDFMRRGRSSNISAARILFSYCAVRHCGHSGAAVSRYLGIGASSVSRAVHKGEQLVRADEEIAAWIAQLMP